MSVKVSVYYQYFSSELDIQKKRQARSIFNQINSLKIKLVFFFIYQKIDIFNIYTL